MIPDRKFPEIRHDITPMACRIHDIGVVAAESRLGQEEPTSAAKAAFDFA
jgi:hypothetical protein